jgi:hypothetical protein
MAPVRFVDACIVSVPRFSQNVVTKRNASQTFFQVVLLTRYTLERYGRRNQEDS